MKPKTGYDKLEDAVDKGPVSGGWHVMKIVAILLVLGIILFGTLGFVFGIFGQGARIVNKTLDADNVLYNYEWFKQQKEDIDTLAIKHKDAVTAAATFKEEAGPREKWDRTDKEEHSRLNTIALGIKQQRDDAVSQYNAKSKMANRNIFKTNDLPDQIKN